MRVLRSRTILPKTGKSALSPTIQPATPAKTNEHPNPPLVASAMQCDLSPLGSGGDSSVRRRSLRLASKASPIMPADACRSDSGKKKTKRRNPSALVSDSSPKIARVLDQLDSGPAKTKRRGSKGESIDKVSVSGSHKDEDLGSMENGGMGSQAEAAEEVVLDDADLELEDDRAGKGGEKAIIQEKKKTGAVKRTSERLAEKHKMEGGVDFVLDLNSAAEDEKEMIILETTGLGFDGGQSEECVEVEGTEEGQMTKRSRLGFSSGVSCFRMQSERLDKRKGADAVFPTLSLHPFTEDGEDKESLNLRSATRICRRKIKEADADSDGIKEDEADVERGGESVEEVFTAEPEMSSQVTDNVTAVHGKKRYSKEEKGKALLIEQDWLSIRIDADKSIAENPTTGVCENNKEKKAEGLFIDKDWLSIGIDASKSGCKEDLTNGVCLTTAGEKRYSKGEKGKRKLIESYEFSISSNEGTLGTYASGVELNEEMLQMALDSVKLKKVAEPKAKKKVWQRNDVVRRNRERFLASAKHFAARFAHFEPSEEDDDGSLPVPEAEIPVEEASTIDEDWPGPFSTAMRIIEERAAKLSARLGSLGSDPSKAGPVIKWVPSRNCDFKRLRPSAPLLRDICFNVLCKNAEAISSLEGIPDALRSKLSDGLCDLRKMSHQMLRLIVSDFPSEICVKDCSCITEEQFQEILGGCNTEQLRVLLLDLSGPCMPDFVLRATLARSPNSLPALTTISLRGAYRLSDDGLKDLVSSAPSLRSINLAECSLLTSTGINILAENLRLVLKELYMDDCQSVDALLILPALKKLKHLEKLSVARIRNVCDKFVCELIPVCGPNMKALVFADCGKLTDISLRAIAENCSRLCTIDLVNLKSLTDTALRHLANGCRSLKVLRLCRNGFSDDGIAAFLEASGESLIELSLNSIKEVANNTAIALAARCSKKLSILDLSWCRKLMDEALGLVVDACLSLRLLRLFGCTQVTDKFLDGHSNSHVNIIGLKLTPVVEHLQKPDTMQSKFCY